MAGGDGRLYRLSAFADGTGGGNPAGVWVGDAFPPDADMQAIAADVGFSETAFLVPAAGQSRRVRYFSPLAEVPFCGHATIASGVVLGRDEGAGAFELETVSGTVPLAVRDVDGELRVSLTSVEPQSERAGDTLLDGALAALGWNRAVLDPAIPPARAYAGAWHLVLALTDREALARLDYDFDALKHLMQDDGLTTVQLVHRERDDLWHSRNPFPVGGVVEDPATGAAAAALGGYLRSAGLVPAPAKLTILQGHDMGRPSRLEVDIPEDGGIVVTGTATFLK